MDISKQHLDIGMFTNSLEAHIGFCKDILRLAFDHMAKLGGGIHQHRFHLNGSILKINHSREPLAPAEPSGFRQLRIARKGLCKSKNLLDPSGTAIQLVPEGEEGVLGVGFDLYVRNRDEHDHFWRKVMSFSRPCPHTYLCGDSLIFVHESPNAVFLQASWKGLGLRYLTVQVHDCARAHEELLRHGAEEAMPPTRMGETATISFVRDPDGNFIEISARHKAQIARND